MVIKVIVKKSSNGGTTYGKNEEELESVKEEFEDNNPEIKKIKELNSKNEYGVVIDFSLEEFLECHKSISIQFIEAYDYPLMKLWRDNNGERLRRRIWWRN